MQYIPLLKWLKKTSTVLVIMTKITMVFRNTKWEEIGISEYLIYKFYKDPNINNTYKDSLCLCDALIFGDFSML